MTKNHTDSKSNPAELSETHYIDKLISASLELTLVIDEKFNIKYCSPSSKRLLGISSEFLNAKSIFAIIDSNDLPKAEHAISFAVDNPKVPVNASFKLQRSNASVMAFEGPIRNLLTDPTVEGLILTLRPPTFGGIASTMSRPAAPIYASKDSKHLHKATLDFLDIILKDHSQKKLFANILKNITALPWLELLPQGAIYLIDPSIRKLSIKGILGENETFESCAFIDFDKGPCGQVAKTGQPFFACDAKEIPGTCNCLCAKNLISFPIQFGRYIVGVINLNTVNPTRPSKEAINFLGMVTKSIGAIVKKEQQTAENKILAANTRESPFPIFECNEKGEFTYENPSARKLMWLHSSEQINLMPPDHNEIITSCLGDNQMVRQEKSNVQDRIYSWYYFPVFSTKRVHIFGRDITDRTLAEQQLVQDAMYDSLTQLPNRTLIIDRLGTALGISRRRGDYSFALLVLNIDHFNLICESLGHAMGDRIVNEVAMRISRCTGTEDTIGRIGSDEFALIIEDASDSDSTAYVAKSILDRINTPMNISGNRVAISTSIGIAHSSIKYDTPEKMLQDATTAMFRARKNRNGYEVFDQQMHHQAVRRLHAHSELSHAIKDGQIIVHYQPVVSVKDKRIRGFEALARWAHPTRGNIPPIDFIPVAETTGLIVLLGDAILRTVCQQVQQWRQQQLPLTWVSVNLSAHQFNMPDLVENIMNIINEYKVDPHWITFEITEGTAAENPERAIQMIQELKEKGFRVALDDFGTGYSSMAYLKQFHIDVIKIDKSFVRDLPDSQDDAAITEAIITMSHSLGLKVVAEGVEDERQALFLLSRDCDEIQGYFYGKPEPPEIATAMLKKTSRSSIPH